ncbi:MULTISPECIES: hypothetical protein [unclassified Nostoc]|uniref:hypothetical protein n=1 Tax=unclassified Nostoc TaxID=2593658 RepID=UPI0025AA9D35|nr:MULTISPECIES: hypothetical protein [unclassified Nostoc]MDM9581442.1 hypothetical protein [Nostoc sp. GT001]MDZ7948313.1 hypothetical protein [Nostoc sp. EfeVER01]MDZ7994995.1 hypothetical protein [Nostoc sp. EspVER01]
MKSLFKSLTVIAAANLNGRLSYTLGNLIDGEGAINPQYGISEHPINAVVPLSSTSNQELVKYQ